MSPIPELLNSILRTDQSKFLLLKDFLHVKKLRSMLTPRAKAQPKENKQSFWQKLISFFTGSEEVTEEQVKKEKAKTRKEQKAAKGQERKAKPSRAERKNAGKGRDQAKQERAERSEKPKSRPVPPQKPKARETELKTDALLRKPRRFHSRLQQKANRKKSNLRDVLRKRLNRQNAPEKPLKFLLLLRPTMKQKLKQLH